MWRSPYSGSRATRCALASRRPRTSRSTVRKSSRKSSTRTARTRLIRSPDSTPMLDVHPPHQSTHTWKDFFIHLATIVVGLLIAISLEQSVEYIHHRHQLAETRDAL